MKSNQTLYISFVSLNELKQRVSKVLKSRNAYKMRKNTIEFGDFAGYNSFMNFHKEAILAAIKIHSPESIYQLASLLKREYSSVHRDCKSLKKMGFIKFVETKKNRKQVRPELIFNYSFIKVLGAGITIQLDNSFHQIA